MQNAIKPFVLASVFFLIHCSFLKLDKESNCLNDKAACFKADTTPPQLASNGAVSPTQGQIVSVLGSVDLMFTEELNDPQPGDFVFSGAADMTVNAVQKLNNFTYRLILTQNSLTSGTIFLNFPNLKDYNGNKITGSSTVSYTGNVDIPVTIPVVDANNVAITNPNHYGLSGTPGGYTTIDVFWYYSYAPPVATPGTTVYSVKWTTGSPDCKDPSATTISSWNVAPTPALGAVATYDNTNATTRAATTNKITLKTTEISTPGTYNRTILICVDNDVNNKHGAGVVNIIRDDTAPVAPTNVTLSPPAGNYPLAKTLTFTCSDNSDRIIYTLASNVGQPADPAPPADPGFTAGVVDVGSMLYDPANKPPTPYTGNTTRTIYKYRCIDKAGNVSAVVTSGAYRVNDSYPTVTFTSFVKSTTNVEIAGLSTSGYTSGTINWSSNQIGQAWELRTDALDCNLPGTVVASGTTPGVAGQVVNTVITTASPNIPATNSYVLRICVSNGTDWAQTSFPLLRDNGPLAAPTVNIAGGSYGTTQNLVFSCGVNADKIAYTMASQAGTGSPMLTNIPDFTIDGALENTISGNTLFSTPLVTQDGFTSIYKAICIDKAGNKSSVLTTGTYTIDSILPTITIVSNSHDALSNAVGYTSTTLTWRSSRGGLPYDIRKGSTDCSEGSPQVLTSPSLQSGTTPVDVNQTITSTFDVANFGSTEGPTTILICVKNLIDRWGYTAKNIIRDTVAPVLPGNTGVTVSAVDSLNFNFNWVAATDATSGVAGYRIYRSDANANNFPNYPATWDYTAVTNSPTLTMPDVSRYFLRIVPVDAAGNVAVAPPYYTVPSTKPAITLVVAGLGGGQSFDLTDGAASTTISANTAGTAWTTSLGAGSTYNFSLSNIPAGKVCAVHEKQFGTLTADLTINISCVDGYQTGQSVNSVAAAKLGYRLFQGKNLAVTGTGLPGSADSPATPTFQFPEYIAHLKGFLYVADTNNYKVRKVTLGSNTVDTLAGTGTVGVGTSADDGPCVGGTPAKLGQPMGVATDGTNLYVAEFDLNRIRKISDINGTCTVITLAGGATGAGTCGGVAAGTCNDGVGIAAQFKNPRQIVANSNYLFVTDNANNRVRRISLSAGMVDTLAGDGNPADANGTGTGARIANPVGLALIGNTLYVSTGLNHIMSIDINTKVVTIVAGDGTAGYVDAAGLNARFNGVYSMTTDGVDLYVGEVTNHLIRRVDIFKSFKVTTLAGTQGIANDVTGVVGANARFSTPHGIATDGRSLFIANHGTHTIRKLTDNGLVGYWPITPGVNPDDHASDAASANNATVVNGGLGTTVGRMGSPNIASTLNGTTQYVTSGTTGLPTGAAARTVCAWFKPTVIPAAFKTIVAYGNTAANNSFALTLVGNGSNASLKLHLNGGGNDLDASNVPIAGGIWSHACGSYDGSRARLYFNGKLLGNEPRSPATPVGSSLQIGRYVNGAMNFDGAIADVRIYNRTLNEGEINELAQDASSNTVITGNSLSTGATGLLSHYAFTLVGASPSLADAGPLNYAVGTFNVPASAIGADGDTAGAYVLDGNTQYITTGTSGEGLPGGIKPRTVCAWVNPQNYPTAAMIASYGQPLNNNAFGLIMYGSTQVGLSAWNNDVLANMKIPLNTWTHLCGAFDGSSATIYRDGLAQTSGSFSGGFSTATGPVMIGKNVGVSAAGYFPGKIDDVRIYNNALSALQIRQLATQVPAGLVRRFDSIDDPSGGKAVDVAGWGENAVIAGTTVAVDRFQQANQSYNFNGTADSISGSDAGLPIGATPRTMCAWIRPTAYPSPGNVWGHVIKYGNTNPSQMETLALKNTNQITHSTYAAEHDVNFSVPLNVWTHLCATNDGTTSTIYANGASLGSAAQTPNTTLAGNAGLFIGQAGYDPNQRFMGDIDEARIYNRVISAAEIRALAGYHPMQVANFSTSTKLHLQSETALCGGSACTNNASISNWPDSSGTGNSVSQVTATNQPIWIANGIGGKPSLQFDQSNDFMINASGAGLNTFNFAHFAVIKSSTANSFPVMSFGTTCGVDDVIFGSDGTGSQYGYGPCNVGLATSGALSGVTPLTPQIFTITGTPTVQGNIYTNGVAGTPYSMAAGAITPGPTLTIGARYGGTGFFYGGLIAEELFFNAPLSATSVYNAPYTDRQIVECYLSAKYSIPMAAGVVCP